MSILKKINSFCALALLTGLCLNFTATTAQAAGELDKIKKQDKIRIAVFSDKPPFGYVDENGENKGYDVYFAKRIAKDLLGDENKVEFVAVEPASRTSTKAASMPSVGSSSIARVACAAVPTAATTATRSVSCRSSTK